MRRPRDLRNASGRGARTVAMTDLAGTAQSALVITVRGRRPGGVCGVVPRRERPSFTPSTVTLSAGCYINQRIAQAAVRRVNAVQAWLDAGVRGDICRLSLRRREVRARHRDRAGPTAPLLDAFPRPFRRRGRGHGKPGSC